MNKRSFIVKIGSMTKATVLVIILTSVSGIGYANPVQVVREPEIFCSDSPALMTDSRTMPLQNGMLSVSRDVPLGTVVYRQRYNRTGNMEVSCQGYEGITRRPPRWRNEYTYPSFTTHFEHTYTHLPLPLSGWNSGPFAGKVYQTGVPGLGVTFTDVNNQPFPFNTAPRQRCGPSRSCRMSYGDRSTIELKLIKIGEVSPGVIQSTSLPQVAVEMHVAGVSRPYTLNLATRGTISMLAKTCDTSDITVPMGSYNRSEFTGDSATDWKRFNIALRNCPAFVGNRLTAEGAQWDDSSSWTRPSGGTAGRFSRSGTASHNIQFRIDPVRAAINSREGVLNLDPSPSGQARAAGGIGIQIATDNGANLPLSVNQNSGLRLQNTPGNYNIPLRARYLQTGGELVTPGPANATATFTIIYQ